MALVDSEAQGPIPDDIMGTAVFLGITVPKDGGIPESILGIEFGVEDPDGQEMIYDGWEGEMVEAIDNFLKEAYKGKGETDLWRHVQMEVRTGSARPHRPLYRHHPEYIRGEPLVRECLLKDIEGAVWTFSGVFRLYDCWGWWLDMPISDPENEVMRNMIFFFPKMPKSWPEDLIKRLRARAALLNRNPEPA